MIKEVEMDWIEIATAIGGAFAIVFVLWFFFGGRESN